MYEKKSTHQIPLFTLNENMDQKILCLKFIQIEKKKEQHIREPQTQQECSVHDKDG